MKYRVFVVGITCVLGICAQTVAAQEAGQHSQRAESGPKTYLKAQGGEITLPMGDLSFADRVVSFDMGPMGNSPDVAYEPTNALGSPRHSGHADGSYVSLGCGGSIVFEFVDNALIDVPGPDLHVWEIGGYVESTRLTISKDGNEWVAIGEITGRTASIDITDHMGLGESFRFGRLTDLESYCRSYPGADIDAVAAVGTAERFVFDSAVLFAFDEASLTAEAEEVLAEFADEIANRDLSALRIEGHTDSVGSATYNEELSLQRADAVRTFLQTQSVLSGITMETRGAGLSEPVADNETEEGRQQNRRVEIIAIP